MFTRVITATVDVSKRDEVMQLWNSNMPHLWKEQKGFIRGYGLINSTSGKCMIISVWDSRESANLYGNSGTFSNAIAPFRPYFTQQPAVDEFDQELEAS